MVKNKSAEKCIVCYCSFAALMLGFCLQLNAQNLPAKVDTTNAQQLNEVRINAKKNNFILKSPTPVQIIAGEELKRINSLSVADAVRYFSGVQLKDYGGVGGLKTVNIRSMGTNHTGVFLDGIAIGNAQNGQVDLGKYTLDNLEEISLLSGQNPNLLQPAKAYASASSIFLKTKYPDFTTNRKQELNVDFKLGDFGLINPNITYKQKLGDRLWSSVSASYIHAHGKYKFRLTNGIYDTTALRNNGDVERFRVQVALFGKGSDSSSWNVQAYSFLSDRGLPGAIIANKFDYTQRMWDKNFFAQGSYQKNFNKFELLLNAKASFDYMRFLDPEYVTDEGFLDNRFKEKEAYFSAAMKYAVNEHWQFSFSSDYLLQDLDANIYRFAYPTRQTFLNVINAAYTTERFNIQGNLLSTSVMDKVEAYLSAGNKQVFSPTLMFSWQLFNEMPLRLRGFYKDIFRMPTFNDLYYTFIGNTLLRPEFTKQYDLGISYVLAFKQSKVKYLEIQTDAYYNTVTDKIVAQPGANLFRWIMYNIGKVEIRGLETNMKMGIGLAKDLDLGLGLNYTYQEAIDVTDRASEYYGDQIPYIPYHSGSFLGRLDYKKWKLNYSFIYTGYRYNQKANILVNYMEPWYTHDVAIGYSFNMGKQVIGVNAEVNNLLNQYYDVIPNFPMPGRNYRLTLSYIL